jgi:predicted porin
MIKKITLPLLASSLILTHTANAEFKLGPITATPGIMYQTNYVGEFTGMISNRSKPTYGVDLNLAHGSGLYLYNAFKEFKNDTDEDSISQYGTYDYELCSVAGFANKIQNLNFDISYENCNIDAKTEENTGTFYVRANADLTKTLNVGAAYAKSSTDGAIGEDDEDNLHKYAQDAFKFNATYDLGVAKTTIAYGEANNLTKFTTLGLNKDFLGVNFDLTYWNVEAANWTGPDQSIDRELLVLSLKKTF